MRIKQIPGICLLLASLAIAGVQATKGTAVPCYRRTVINDFDAGPSRILLIFPMFLRVPTSSPKVSALITSTFPIFDDLWFSHTFDDPKFLTHTKQEFVGLGETKRHVPIRS